MPAQGTARHVGGYFVTRWEIATMAVCVALLLGLVVLAWLGVRTG
jgi:hypothetical protein